MHIALRTEDGIPFSPNVYNNVRDFADLLVRQLLEQFSMDPRLRAHKSVTKSLFKSLFYTEYRQAILALDANEKLLRLCARHWKAEVLISQAFLRRGGSGAEIKREHSVAPVPSSIAPVPSSIVPVPSSTVLVLSSVALVPLSVAPVPTPVVPIPMRWDVEDMAPNAPSKRPLELSPGPKSPSASHAQKRTKDGATLLGLRTSSSLVPAGE